MAARLQTPKNYADGVVVGRFGKGRRDAEDFVRSFEDVFFMQRRRVLGDNVRLLKCFGGKWQVSRLLCDVHTVIYGRNNIVVGHKALDLDAMCNI